jgi:isopentenyl-diphosphate delta-isomerase
MTRTSRKMDHIRYALSIDSQGDNGLLDLRFIHNPLPEISLKDISLATQIGDLKLSSPILINAMTGGAIETEEINHALGSAAHATGAAMAVGSQMAALRDASLAHSYRVARKANPNGILFANLGSEATPDQALRAIEMIDADAMQIHLNVVQELVMKEGDRTFDGMLKRIESIVRRVEIPVIVKEVGFGMTAEAVAKLLQIGVQTIDCGGRGGTNFAAIENARRADPIHLFNQWGNSTSVSILEARQVAHSNQLIASGGIRNAMECALAIAVGATCIGMAGALLKIVREDSLSALIEHLRLIQEEIRMIMAALGARSIAELQRMPLIISGETAHWCYARGIDIRTYAMRRHESPDDM